MKLRATDQISISAVKADSLRPGEEFEVSEALGSELLNRHPARFVRLDAEEKAAPAPLNKAEPAPANKATRKRSAK